MENQNTANLEQYKAEKKLERIIIYSLVAFVAILIVAIVSIVVANRARRNLAAYNSLIAQLQLEETRLEQDVAYMQTDPYLEQHAREELGMVQKGESYYIFDGKNA